MFFNLKKISSSLLLRSFYLISIPIVLIQIIGIIVFFELHWDLVLKKMSNNIINNVELFINEYDHYTEVPLISVDPAGLISGISIPLPKLLVIIPSLERGLI